jgi:hypothetical protein
MTPTTELELRPVQLLHGVLLCAISGAQLIVGEVAGHADMLPDILDYAAEQGCTSVLFHTSRKGLLVRAIETTNALHGWTAPQIVGYVVEVKRENEPCV